VGMGDAVRVSDCAVVFYKFTTLCLRRFTGDAVNHIDMNWIAFGSEVSKIMEQAHEDSKKRVDIQLNGVYVRMWLHARSDTALIMVGPSAVVVSAVVLWQFPGRLAYWAQVGTQTVKANHWDFYSTSGERRSM